MEHSKNLSSFLLGADVNKLNTNKEFSLVKLPYLDNDLEPYIGETTIKFHYGKHLLTYINNLNNLKKGTEFDNKPLCYLAKSTQDALFNNAAQVFNHYFYFLTLSAPSEDGIAP